uniref:Uncharacterized protein n=1 Tax=Avena sativa TaxID=4498 RepID=A0ACD5Z1J3_AVESA
MASALRLLLRQHAVAPQPPMLRSLFPAPYSKVAAAAAASLPAVRSAPLPPPRLREVTPRKAPPTPKGEPRCCTTVPSAMTDSTKSLPDKLKDLKDSHKSLQAMYKNIEEHIEMIKTLLHDRTAAIDLLSKRLDDHQKLLDKLRAMQGDYRKIRNMRDGLAKLSKMGDEYDKDQAIESAKGLFIDEQLKILNEKHQDYRTALSRYRELERSTMEQVQKVEKLKKVAKVGAAVGLVGGLLLILAKI